MFTSRSLKWLALVLMIGDHLSFFFPNIFPAWLRYPGRIVAPIFIWLVAQNIQRTTRPLAYLGRLWVAALGMSIGTALVVAIGYAVTGMIGSFLTSINIFLPLGITASVAYLYKQRSQASPLIQFIIGAILLLLPLGIGLFVEGGARLLYLAYLFILFGHHKTWLVVTSSLFTAAMLVITWVDYGNLLTDFQWMWIGALVPIILTRSTKVAVSKSEKYFFYLFYPIHLWVLYGIWLVTWY
jgi:hypothetical protein